MLEFVSVLRRLVGGDTKVAPTADDKVLIVDAADSDKVKTARVGDMLAAPVPVPFSPTSFDGLSYNYMTTPGHFMYREVNPGPRYLPADRRVLIVINHEHGPITIFATQDGNQVIYDTEDNHYLNDSGFTVPFGSATMFVPFLSHWMAIRLNWSA